MPSVAPNQLTLSFEPSIAERHATLRDFIAYRIQVQAKPAKSIASDMDMAPSTLTRKLTAGRDPDDKDTQRFNVDDLERYMRETKDTSPIEYLAAKYMHSDETRKARAIARVEALAVELANALTTLKG
jgi:hypothetical protein